MAMEQHLTGGIVHINNYDAAAEEKKKKRQKKDNRLHCVTGEIGKRQPASQPDRETFWDPILQCGNLMQNDIITTTSVDRKLFSTFHFPISIALPASLPSWDATVQ